MDTHPRGATERRKTVRSGFPTKDAAERELLEGLRAVQSETYSPPSKQTLERYLGPWLDGKSHLRPTTRETYAILIERYICNKDYAIGTAPLQSLTRPGIRHFYAELERRGRMRGGRTRRTASSSSGRIVMIATRAVQYRPSTKRGYPPWTVERWARQG